MKTATLPVVRIAPELRARAEDLLAPTETLSAFVEEAVRQRVEVKESQAAFIARGLAARDEAKLTGNYISADAMLARLRARLDHYEAKALGSPDVPAHATAGTRSARARTAGKRKLRTDTLA